MVAGSMARVGVGPRYDTARPPASARVTAVMRRRLDCISGALSCNLALGTQDWRSNREGGCGECVPLES